MRHAGARGFTYLGLVILLAIMALAAAAGLKMGTLLQRAAAEEELLEIGAQFSEALRSYAAATPAGKPTHPPSLQELLKDPRFPNPRRHLRKIFVDPVTGKAEWGVIYLGEKVGVIGVYSLSNRRPLKIANFDIRFVNMDNREKISDWKFLLAGGEGGMPAVPTPPNAMTGAPSAPSLFPPGTPGVDAGGKSGAPTGLTAGIPNQPAQAPMPQEPEPAEESKPEDTPVMDPPAEEAKEESEKEPPPDGREDESAKPVEPSTIVPPPPWRR